ncbi:helix-turn-helix domain-containing protein [Chryseobacterium contaminans]|uniref:AraC-type DNA-binding protein n=1 Tax=Chryseobacterium contaminans TaxID=1423959 RepID=A0A1M6ZDI3_9FLAO|nr:AraC family transcriptional regulator [Chryseobacterium contaminans]SHL28507.1 AraC-type DNA-binding protein [Chryseobacterium contaminans]
MTYKKYHWWMNKNKNGNTGTGLTKALFFVLSILISCSYYSQTPDPKNAQELITKQYNIFNLKGIDPDINDVKKLIQQSEKLDFTEGTLRGLIMLQRLAIRKGDYKLADNYTEQAENIAHQKGYDYKLTAAYFNKANAYLKLKMYKEAKAMVDKAMAISQSNPDKVDKQLWASQKYSFMAGVAAEFNKHDSIIYYTKKSLATVEAIPTKNLTDHQKIIYYHFLIFQLMNMGISCTESMKPPRADLAESYFKKALSYSTTQPQYFKRAGIEVYESVSNFYFEQKDYPKAIEYSKKVLELERTNRKVEERLLALGRLKDSYGILKNNDEERKYLKLYTALKDSTDNVERKAIVNDARNQISKSKKEVTAEYKEDRKNIFLVSAGVIVLILIAAWQYSIYGKRKYRQKYDQLISKLNNENSVQGTEIEKKETVYNNAIYSETEQKLLKKLQAFEASDKFLKPEISMNLLASHFKTNATYLSKIINKVKNQNFNNYINSLRINYITNKLYNEKKYREYKISYLAEECGYASTQVFVIAFKNEHGVTPSYFIKQLKSDSDAIESTDGKVTDLSV